MLKIIQKLKSSKSTQTWYNLDLHQYLSFEPNFGSFRLDEKLVKIEAKRSWNWSMMLKIEWKLKSSKPTQTLYNLQMDAIDDIFAIFQWTLFLHQKLTFD